MVFEHLTKAMYTKISIQWQKSTNVWVDKEDNQNVKVISKINTFKLSQNP